MQTFYIYRKPYEAYQKLDTPKAHRDCLLISGSHRAIWTRLNEIHAQKEYLFYEQRHLVEKMEIRYKQISEIIQAVLQRVTASYSPKICQVNIKWLYDLAFYPEEQLTVVIYDES